MLPADLEFPFQQVVVDFVDIQGKSYMVYADRYKGWVEVVFMSLEKAENMCDTMRTWFCTYGAPKEISSDGEPPFESQEYDTFLKNWGIWKCTSSAYYLQSNGHAELAVKTVKWILFNNIDNCERLGQDQAVQAFLTYHNTAIQDLDMSLAVMLYGQIIKDYLLVRRDKYKTRKQWNTSIDG